MKTPQEIEKLKNDWIYDPCWDIEDTDGFEDHREELLAFAEKQRAQWKEKNHERDLACAERFGLAGNAAAGRELLAMEARLCELERQVSAFCAQ